MSCCTNVETCCVVHFENDGVPLVPGTKGIINKK